MATSEQQSTSQHEQQPSRQQGPLIKPLRNKGSSRDSRQTSSYDSAPFAQNGHAFIQPSRQHTNSNQETASSNGSNHIGVITATPADLKDLASEDLSERSLHGRLLACRKEIASLQEEAVYLEQAMYEVSRIQRLETQLGDQTATIANLRAELKTVAVSAMEELETSQKSELALRAELTSRDAELEDSRAHIKMMEDYINKTVATITEHHASAKEELARTVVTAKSEAEKQRVDNGDLCRRLDLMKISNDETLSCLGEWQDYASACNEEMLVKSKEADGLRELLGANNQEIAVLQQQLGEPERLRHQHVQSQHHRQQQQQQQAGAGDSRPAVTSGPGQVLHQHNYSNAHMQQHQQAGGQLTNLATNRDDLAVGHAHSVHYQQPGEQGAQLPGDRGASGGALLLEDSSLGGLLLDCVPAGEEAAQPLHNIAANVREKLRADGTVWEEHYQRKHGSIETYLQRNPHFVCRRDGSWYNCGASVPQRRPSGGVMAGPDSGDATVERPGVNNVAAVVTRPAPYQPAGTLPLAQRDAPQSGAPQAAAAQPEQQQQPRQQPWQRLSPQPPSQHPNQSEHHQKPRAAQAPAALQPPPLPPPPVGEGCRGATHGVMPAPIRLQQTVLLTPPAPQWPVGTPLVANPAERSAQQSAQRSVPLTHCNKDTGAKSSVPQRQEYVPPPGLVPTTRDGSAANHAGEPPNAFYARNAVGNSGTARNSSSSKTTGKPQPSSSFAQQGGSNLQAKLQLKQSGSTPRAQPAADGSGGGGASQRAPRSTRRNSKKKGSGGNEAPPQ